MYEKVNPAHLYKVADRIAGALVDIAYSKEDDPKIAVEVLIGHGVCHIIREFLFEYKEHEKTNKIDFNPFYPHSARRLRPL